MDKRWSELKTVPNYPESTGETTTDIPLLEDYIKELGRRIAQISLCLSDSEAPVNMLQRVVPKLESRRKEAEVRLKELAAGRTLTTASSALQPQRITEEQAARNFHKLLQGAPLIIELKDGTSIGSFDLTAAPPSSDLFAVDFACPVCSQSAKSKFELRMHITRSHLVHVKALKKLKMQSLLANQQEPYNTRPVPVESLLLQNLTEAHADSATSEIEEVFSTRVLRNETLTMWQKEVQRIQSALQEAVPEARLLQYGSSSNGFATVSSDIDLTVDVDVIKFSFKSDREKAKCEDWFGSEETIDLAYKLFFDQLVIVLHSLGYNNIEERFEARIPIVKCINQDLGMEMDISLANLVAVENSLLLSTYSSIDLRAKQLGIAIKTWAKARRIGNPATHTLSSYSYLMLLIAFLQKERLLPNLQAEYSEDYRIMRGEFDCSFEHDPDLFRHLAQQIQKSTGQLLFDFFKYYSLFDWKTNCVSIRATQNLTKAEKQWTKTLIAIEDPFELKRNLGDVSAM